MDFCTYLLANFQIMRKLSVYLEDNPRFLRIKLKVDFVFFCFFIILFAACSTEELDLMINETTVIIEEPVVDKETTTQPAADPVEILPSKALRTALKAIRENLSVTTAAAQESKANEAFTLCFRFVYPLTVKYNDGSTQRLDDYDTLLKVLLDESNVHHLTALGLLFEVMEEGRVEVSAIKNEQEFQMLIVTCGYNKINYTDIINSVNSCFTTNYPLNLIVSNSVKTFMNQQEAEDYFNKYWSSSATVSISYPFRVTLHTMEEEERTPIENDFEMINLIKNS